MHARRVLAMTDAELAGALRQAQATSELPPEVLSIHREQNAVIRNEAAQVITSALNTIAVAIASITEVMSMVSSRV